MPDAEDHDDSYALRQRAAAYLDEHLEEVFRRWEERVVAEVPAAGGLATPLLRDHLTPHMRTIVTLLNSPTVDMARQQAYRIGDTDISAEETHGRLRATLPGYSVDQLVEEYITLRQTVTDTLEEKSLLNKQVMDILALVNERAMAGAAAQFTHSLEVVKERAVSMLMHDIRNPLNVISLTSEVIRQKLRNPDLEKDVETIRANVAKIDRMVTELLDAVRLGAGEGLELQFVQTDLRQVVVESTDGAKLAYPGRIELDISDAPLNGWFDQSAITRAVENLISNAIKYGAAEKKVLIDLKVDPDYYIISVHNWGEPIAEHQQVTLFVTFARGQKQSKLHHERGWGIGLAYVKAVAEGHGGSVRLESSREQGTTFSILLPRNWSPD